MSETTVTTTEQTTVVETVEQTVVIQVITPEGTELVETEQGTTVVEVYVQGPQGPQGEGADVLTQTITNGDTTHAPSGDAVFDALALQTAATAAVATDLATHEADTSNPHATTQTQLGISAFIQTLTDDANQAAAQATLGIGSAGTLAYSTDGTFAANSDALIPTQKAVKTYADGLIAANDVMQLKGVVDCSANPNYPAADAGHTYRVSVAGKIGGASGVTVEAGDILLCLTDGTASGNHATVGASWTVVQVNIIGALVSSDIGSTVQGYDADLAAIAALAPANDDIIQRKAGAWTNRTMVQLKADLSITIADVSGTMAQFNTACTDGDFGFLGEANTWTGQNTFAAGTLTTSTPSQWTQTWNSAGVTFTALDLNVTDTASNAASILLNLRVGGTSKWNVTKAGKAFGTTDSNAPTFSFIGQTTTGLGYFNSGNLFWANGSYPLHLQSAAAKFASNVSVGWSSSADSTTSADTTQARAAANSIVSAGSSAGAGAVTSRTEINKLVSAIADATATAVFTVTVPNAAHSANVEVTLNGSLGAGGAIGANEAMGTIKYNVSIARTAGVNAVATISTAYGSTTSSVAGAATITVTGDLSAISGAVGATNTFTIRVTITKGSGSSANHTCTAHAVLLNANASGITIA